MSTSNGYGKKSHREVFLVGKRIGTIPITQLPTKRTVLQYYHYRDLMLRADFPNISSVSIASCPLGDFFTAQCAEIGGCLQKCLPCVLYEVKKIWQKAGIPFVNTDKHIRDKIVDLEKKRKDLNKHRNRLSKNLVLKRETFSRMLEEVFDVSQNNCEHTIMKDKTKDLKTRREDVDFLNNQKGARVQKMLGKDLISQNIVKNKRKREMEKKNQSIKESIRKQKELVTEKFDDTMKNLNTLDNDQDEQYLQPSIKIKKYNAVPLIVPKNIGKDLAPTASRYGISSTALSATLASLINNSSRTSDDFSISKRSILRQKKSSISATACKIKDNFIILAKGKSLTVHFDSIIMVELEKLVKKKLKD
ncbi:uncharacterized protein LOC124816317 [Hydra vulgaris]|uniref:uncharacterized protein LOC124816317 n=1 Tax=Hydra vulgaris TaxID=6087 RepID=UPI0032E9F348